MSEQPLQAAPGVVFTGRRPNQQASEGQHRLLIYERAAPVIDNDTHLDPVQLWGLIMADIDVDLGRVNWKVMS